jgi:hypothetical protein
MYKAVVLVLVVTGLLWCLEAWAQDLGTRRKLADERAAVSVRAVDKPAKKEEGGQPAVKNEALSIEIQTPDIMTYLLENKGKIGDCSESTGLPPEDVYRKVRVRTLELGGPHDVRSR